MFHIIYKPPILSIIRNNFTNNNVSKVASPAQLIFDESSPVKRNLGLSNKRIQIMVHRYKIQV